MEKIAVQPNKSVHWVGASEYGLGQWTISRTERLLDAGSGDGNEYIAFLTSTTKQLLTISIRTRCDNATPNVWTCDTLAIVLHTFLFCPQKPKLVGHVFCCCVSCVSSSCATTRRAFDWFGSTWIWPRSFRWNVFFKFLNTSLDFRPTRF